MSLTRVIVWPECDSEWCVHWVGYHWITCAAPPAWPRQRAIVPILTRYSTSYSSHTGGACYRRASLRHTHHCTPPQDETGYGVVTSPKKRSCTAKRPPLPFSRSCPNADWTVDVSHHVDVYRKTAAGIHNVEWWRYLRVGLRYPHVRSHASGSPHAPTPEHSVLAGT